MSVLPRRYRHRGFTIVADASGISIDGFGSGYDSVDAARKAIDDHLDRPKEIPALPLPEPSQPSRRIRH